MMGLIIPLFEEKPILILFRAWNWVLEDLSAYYFEPYSEVHDYLGMDMDFFNGGM